MDTANIKGSNAIFIAKDSIDNASQTSIIKRALPEPETRAEQGVGKSEQQRLVAGNEEVFQRADYFKQSTGYDENSNLRIRQELAIYRAIETQEKRDDITQLLGVDIYA